jgi:hypothetical protein
MIYQLHLLDKLGIRQAVETYRALDDDDALEVACGVHRAVSDHFDRYEVWQRDRRISDDAHQPPRGTSLEEIIAKRVDMVLELEERLASSREAISKSLKLMETVNNLVAWRSRR